MSQLILAPALAAYSIAWQIPSPKIFWFSLRVVQPNGMMTGSFGPFSVRLESSVECAGFNVAALLPIMKRLAFPDQTIGMVNIPQVESEFLA